MTLRSAQGGGVTIVQGGRRLSMSNMRTVLIASVAIVLAAGLAGCREEEQDRPLHLDKGVYSGKADTGLTEDQRRALERRGQLQKF